MEAGKGGEGAVVPCAHWLGLPYTRWGSFVFAGGAIGWITVDTNLSAYRCLSSFSRWAREQRWGRLPWTAELCSGASGPGGFG